MSNVITVNGVEYVPATEAPEPSPFKIVVADRGWIIAGHVTRDEDSGDTVITSAVVVRRWGTTKGLGELAASGPIAGKTTLDPAGVVRIPSHAVMLTLDSKAELWG